MTPKGISRLAELEGTKLTIYPDAGGHLSIGIGHLLTKDELSSGKIGPLGLDFRRGITVAMANYILQNDLLPVHSVVSGSVSSLLTDNQLDALEMFAFNVGCDAFLRSSLLTKINNRDLASVPAQMRRWIYSGGKICPGLVNRREAEIAIWEGKDVAQS